MNPLHLYKAELERESQATRRILEAVPADKLDWKPHPKSSSLGKLATHVATIPGMVTGMAKADSFDLATRPDVTPAATKDAILRQFDASLAAACANLDAETPERLGQDWHVMHADKVLMTVPRAGVFRSFMLSHLIHHRGQLTVYLRLLDVPLPSVYGPTADVNPFA